MNPFAKQQLLQTARVEATRASAIGDKAREELAAVPHKVTRGELAPNFDYVADLHRKAEDADRVYKFWSVLLQAEEREAAPAPVVHRLTEAEAARERARKAAAAEEAAKRNPLVDEPQNATEAVDTRIAIGRRLDTARRRLENVQHAIATATPDTSSEVRQRLGVEQNEARAYLRAGLEFQAQPPLDRPRFPR